MTAQLHARWMNVAADTTSADRDRPSKASINPDRGLGNFTKQPYKLNGALLSAFRQANFLGRSQPFIPSNAVQGVAERASKQCRNRDRTVILRPLLGAQPQAKP